MKTIERLSAIGVTVFSLIAYLSKYLKSYLYLEHLVCRKQKDMQLHRNFRGIKKLIKTIGSFAVILSTMGFMSGQDFRPKSSSELYHDLQRLNFLGNVLYVAAHPDDENTRLISYLTHKTHANTAYLSLTRGDGGQNLIGTEIRELLGVLRTQELLAARGVDGGQPFFTRANDFRYSKTPE